MSKRVNSATKRPVQYVSIITKISENRIIQRRL